MSATFAVVPGGDVRHVLPALAIAEGLVARGHAAATIHYVGTERGVEQRLLPPTRSSDHVVRRRRRCSAACRSPQPRLRARSWSGRRAGPRVLLAPPAAEGGGQRRRLRQLPGDVRRTAARASRSSSSATTGGPAWCPSCRRPRFAAPGGGLPGSALPRAEVTGAPVRRRSVPSTGRPAATTPGWRSACPPTASWSR